MILVHLCISGFRRQQCQSDPRDRKLRNRTVQLVNEDI